MPSTLFAGIAQTLTQDAPYQSSDSHYRTNSEAPTLFGSELDLSRSETSARSSIADTASNSTLDPSRPMHQSHSRKGSGSLRSSHGGLQEGLPPTAPEPRSKHVAAAMKEMRELREFSAAVDRPKKPVVLGGERVEDAIERQGTASTLEGTITGSEWGGISDRGVDSTSYNGNNPAKEQLKEGGVAGPAIESSAQPAKTRDLFGGAAEKIGQWGPKLAGRRFKGDSMSESQEGSEDGSVTTAELMDGELKPMANGTGTAPTTLSPSPRETRLAANGRSAARGQFRGAAVDGDGDGHGHRSARDISRRRQQETECEANYGVGGSNFASDGAHVESRRSRGSAPRSRGEGRTSSRERRRLVEETGAPGKDRRRGEVSSSSGRRERSSRDLILEGVPAAPRSTASGGSRREGASERERRDSTSTRRSTSSRSPGTGDRANRDSRPRRDSRSRRGSSRGPREDRSGEKDCSLTNELSRSSRSVTVTAAGLGRADNGGRDKRHGKDRASSSRSVAVDRTKHFYSTGGGDVLDRSEPSRGSNLSSSSAKHERRRSDGSGDREPRRSERPSSAGKRMVPELKFPLFSHHIREEEGGAPPRSKSSRNIPREDGVRERGGDDLGRTRTHGSSGRSSSSRAVGGSSAGVVPDEPWQRFEEHHRQSNGNKVRDRAVGILFVVHGWRSFWVFGVLLGTVWCKVITSCVVNEIQ